MILTWPQEVPVEWREIPGSKLSVLSSTLTMARDLLLIRLCYLLRVWRVADMGEGRHRKAM